MKNYHSFLVYIGAVVPKVSLEAKMNFGTSININKPCNKELAN